MKNLGQLYQQVGEEKEAERENGSLWQRGWEASLGNPSQSFCGRPNAVMLQHFYPAPVGFWYQSNVCDPVKSKEEAGFGSRRCHLFDTLLRLPIHRSLLLKPCATRLRGGKKTSRTLFVPCETRCVHCLLRWNNHTFWGSPCNRIRCTV